MSLKKFKSNGRKLGSVTLNDGTVQYLRNGQVFETDKAVSSYNTIELESTVTEQTNEDSKESISIDTQDVKTSTSKKSKKKKKSKHIQEEFVKEESQD